MATLSPPKLHDLTVNESFFAPIAGIIAGSECMRSCPDLSDDAFIQLGVTRAISSPRTGRGFLQQIGTLLEYCPDTGHFFETLKSKRRLGLLQDVDARVANLLPVCAEAAAIVPKYALYAGDGHWHGAAARDLRIDERRWAVGHLYALNLLTRAMHHLALCEGKKEHDMSAIKRLGADSLRMNEPKGTKVLWVWDRAGIDFPLWQHWKQVAGIYFISRTKENLNLTPIASRLFARNDPVNQGVVSDSLVVTGQGFKIRQVCYQDPVSGEIFEFITTVLDLPPGVIAWIYKKRWDVEKVFDQFKNKLEEAKAWASSDTAKTMQAHFLCLTHNLLELFERKIALEHKIKNEAGLRRQEKRRCEQIEAAAKSKRAISTLLTHLLRPLQRSVKLIRWLRSHWFSERPISQSLPLLKAMYAKP